MMRDFFLADDLSGALDAAAAFHHAGRSVTVALSCDDWPEPDGAVLGLTTETRNLRPVAAAARIAATLAEAQARGARLVYKKIDSTLRGPIGAEVAALCAALPQVRVLFCPANPPAGRTVRDGVLRVHGVPVAETDFGRDPANPVRTSAVRELLGGAATERVWIADAETEADLAGAIERMEAAGQPWVGVGSGALAKALAARRSSRERGAPPVWDGPRSGPALFVCGSAHPVNRPQAAELARATGWISHEVKVSEPGASVAEVEASVRARGGAILRIEAPRAASEAALRAITATASRVVHRAGITRLFVTGGETAFALGTALGLRRLQFGAEIEPGLSISVGEAGGRRMIWAVKPGGFGDVQTWCRARRAWQAAGVGPGSISPEQRPPPP